MIRTLSGNNGFTINDARNRLIDEFRDKYGDFAIEQINCDEVDYQTILDSLYNLPFLTPAKLVVLHSPNANKQLVENFVDVLTRIPDSIEVLIIESTIDKRAAFYKQLKKLTQFEDYQELDPHNLANWIVQTVKGNGGEIRPVDANHLIEFAGTNQLKLSNEISKLLSYENVITNQTIDLLVEPTPQTTIFQLLDSVFSGRRTELMKAYEDQRRQKVEPQQILAMLTWQLHILALVKSAGDVSPAEIASKAKLSPFVVSKSLRIANKMGLAEIRSITNELLDLDVKLKSQTLDADEALLQLLLSMSSVTV